MLGHERLWEQPWPVADPALLVDDDGRGRRPGERQAARPAPRCRSGTAEDELVALALGSERVQAHLGRRARRDGRSSCRQARQRRRL